MSISRLYTKELRDQLGYTATWLPNCPLKLGETGVLAGYQFHSRGSLTELGIPFKTGTPGPAADIGYASSGSVTREFKLAGQVPSADSHLAAADSGVVISFDRQAAVVFMASGCTVAKIDDMHALRTRILAAYNEGRWEGDRVVVTEILLAKSTTVLMSSGNKAKIELRAHGAVDAPDFNLINVKGRFSIAWDVNVTQQILAEGGLTPLFRCVGVRRGLLRPDVVERSDPSKADTLVVELDYDDFREDAP
jgi:hypothetical protein